MGEEFWRHITRDEIITDYNTKAVNVDVYQRRDNNRKVTQQEKLKTNPATDEQFISKALLCSILYVVEKASTLVICNGQSSFSHQKDKRVRHKYIPSY